MGQPWLKAEVLLTMEISDFEENHHSVTQRGYCRSKILFFQTNTEQTAFPVDIKHPLDGAGDGQAHGRGISVLMGENGCLVSPQTKDKLLISLSH